MGYDTLSAAVSVTVDVSVDGASASEAAASDGSVDDTTVESDSVIRLSVAGAGGFTSASLNWAGAAHAASVMASRLIINCSKMVLLNIVILLMIW
jgi:hypothetical protein